MKLCYMSPKDVKAGMQVKTELSSGKFVTGTVYVVTDEDGQPSKEIQWSDGVKTELITDDWEFYNYDVLPTSPARKDKMPPKTKIVDSCNMVDMTIALAKADGYDFSQLSLEDDLLEVVKTVLHYAMLAQTAIDTAGK